MINVVIFRRSRCVTSRTRASILSTYRGIALVLACLRHVQFTVAECPVNQYQNGTGCSNCFPNSVSLAGSTVVTDCMCVPGWTPAYRKRYKAVLNSTDCNSWLHGTYTEYTDALYNGARVYQKTTPDPVFLWRMTRNSPKGNYHYVITRTLGDTSDYGFFSTTPEPDIQNLRYFIETCVNTWATTNLVMFPSADGFGKESTSCAKCPADHYKTIPGPSACLPCLFNSVSVAGSTGITDCQCSPGWTGENAAECTQCPAGKFTI